MLCEVYLSPALPFPVVFCCHGCFSYLPNDVSLSPVSSPSASRLWHPGYSEVFPGLSHFSAQPHNALELLLPSRVTPSKPECLLLSRESDFTFRCQWPSMAGFEHCWCGGGGPGGRHCDSSTIPSASLSGSTIPFPILITFTSGLCLVHEVEADQCRGRAKQSKAKGAEQATTIAAASGY